MDYTRQDNINYFPLRCHIYRYNLNTIKSNSKLLFCDDVADDRCLSTLE